MTFFVYHIGCSPDVHQGYIGVSGVPKRRFATHTRGATIVGRAIRKYGLLYEQNLTIIDAFDTPEEAYLKEFELRPNPKIGWNLNAGGMGPRRFAPEVCEKISLAMSGARNHRFGVHPSAQVREKAREILLGAGNHRFGLLNDATHRARISATLIGKPAEWRSANAAKAGSANLGIKKSNAQKSNMAAAAKNRPRLTCPHCGKEGQVQGLKRYHMDNCRQKGASL